MLIVFLIVLVISVQVTQQVYVADDWVRSTNNNLNVEIQNQHDVEKALGLANHEKNTIGREAQGRRKRAKKRGGWVEEC